ncbi:GGDEF domain-containing protein [Arsenicicoccus piscis]|uniref:GGDEF domain-containing protein n=1 Tax=Arsenicicoccus piscis TaxID=673954 RepID=A0ABQ6HU97_9MICO|nr:diguanylate cyclase [Arsenicicoccus piscis]GMA22106.1 hypothetical protein GCM10025862_41290 [Arsenicicoccus piscis]
MHPRELSAVRDAGALTALAELDDVLATTGSRAELVDELRTHLPGLLLADRITLGLQSADASQVEMTVLVGDGDDTDETYLRPTAGSSLQRARDIGVLHLTDLDQSPVPQDVALANRGYRERLVLPLRFGDATIGILSLSTRAPITEETVTVARLAAAIVSTRSHRFGVPEPSDDARTLETQIAQLRHAAHALERTDPLTRLPNRVAVFEAIDEARAAAALGTHSAFAFIDLDHYKITNDKHGHKTGDIVLQSLADRLRGLSGEAPVAFGRVGGDEFGALYYGEAEDLKALLDRLGAELTSHPSWRSTSPSPPPSRPGCSGSTGTATASRRSSRAPRARPTRPSAPAGTASSCTPSAIPVTRPRTKRCVRSTSCARPSTTAACRWSRSRSARSAPGCSRR